MSNLALQMSLYFNVYFSPFWYTTCIVMLVAKVIIVLATLFIILIYNNMTPGSRGSLYREAPPERGTFSVIMECKTLRGWALGRASLCKTLLSTPLWRGYKLVVFVKVKNQKTNGFSYFVQNNFVPFFTINLH